jgi:hypothetical protein
MNDECKEDKKYQGWTNYETWAVALWLNNEEGSYRYWREQAREWCDYEDTTIHLVEQLKEELNEAAPELGTTLYADLMNSALERVDWYEIAESFLEDVDDEWTEEKPSCDASAMPEPTPEKPESSSEQNTEADDVENFFGNCISRYTREQAIEDGVLVEVKESTAKEAGFKIPVAMTSTVWAKYVEVPPEVECQDLGGRLWDVLWMCRHGIVSGKKLDQSVVLFQLHVRNDNQEGEPPLVTLKAVCGPDDDGAPCITIMLPEED